MRKILLLTFTFFISVLSYSHAGYGVNRVRRIVSGGGGGGAGVTLPLPNGDTTYLAVNGSQTVTGSPTFGGSGSSTTFNGPTYINGLISINKFAIQGSSQVNIGQSTGNAILTVSTPSATGQLLVSISTGNVLFEIAQSSITFGTGTIKINGITGIPYGTSGTPSFFLNNNPTTGIFGASGQYSVTISGSEKMRITASGISLQGSGGFQGVSGNPGTTTFGFNSATNYGMFNPTNQLAFATAGVLRLVLGSNGETGISDDSKRASLSVSTCGTANLPILVVSSGMRNPPIIEVMGSSVTIASPTFHTAYLNVMSIANTTSYAVAIGTTPGNYQTAFTTNGYITQSSSTMHTLSSCGTSPTIYGGASAFTVTPGGGGPTGCTVTFGVPFTNPPIVVATPRTGSVTNTFSYTVTNTAITVTETGIGVFDVIMVGHD